MRVSSKRCPGGDPGSRDSRWPFVSGEGAEVLGGSAGRAAPTPPTWPLVFRWRFYHGYTYADRYMCVYIYFLR